MEFKVELSADQNKDNESVKSLSSTMSNDDNLRILEQMSECSQKTKHSINDFDIIDVLGKGSYAQVILGKNNYTGELRAIKMIEKKFLEKVVSI
jgi:hypothetical protein